MVVKGCVSVYVIVTLLSCVLGSKGLDLLKSAIASRMPPSTPEVHCRCSAYPTQTLCSLVEPQQVVPTHYIITYSERHRPSVTKQCNFTQDGSSSSALNSNSISSSDQQIWNCRLEDLKLLTDYIINVTAVNSLGSRSNFTSFMLEDIVKPDPPVDMRVSPVGFKKLLVEWAPPPTWSNLDIFPLKYKIQYQWETRGTKRGSPVQLGPYENSRVELKGLTTHRTYLVQVCSMELLGLGECSNWSKAVKVTIPKQ